MEGRELREKGIMSNLMMGMGILMIGIGVIMVVIGITKYL